MTPLHFNGLIGLRAAWGDLRGGDDMCFSLGVAIAPRRSVEQKSAVGVQEPQKLKQFADTVYRY